MADIIRLLPDTVANQIAAGEVIQRPASVVKELLENAVDAGAEQITVVIKDAGKTLIQVIDNGIGMSDTDARMAFERHATSKISKTDDLFQIRTKGFRGEALASIAAIAMVILKTRQASEEIGTEITVSASRVEQQIPANCIQGSNFTVKNLFFNIPARRKFLKGNSTELKHLMNEYQRVVLAHPEIEFKLIHNESVLYDLPKSVLKNRVLHVFGKGMNTNLIPVMTKTSLIEMTGFIGKPEHSKKTTGEQYFFVNNRYMRHPYFHRAVLNAYERLILPDSHPCYFIYFNITPETIDVNIHPTKTEIKFENEQAIFQIIQAGIKEALGKSNAVPSLDFSKEGIIDIPVIRKDTKVKLPEIGVDDAYNPFFDEDYPNSEVRFKKQTIPENWEELYAGVSLKEDLTISAQSSIFTDEDESQTHQPGVEFLQLKYKYILTPVRSGLMIIDQKRAHERILYEYFVHNTAHNGSIAQRELYPTKLDLDAEHYILINEVKNELQLFGVEISDLGSNTIVVNTCPASLDYPDLRELIEQFIEEYKQTGEKKGKSIINKVAASLARAGSLGYEKLLHPSEMQKLVDELFACENPNYSPSGEKILSIISLDNLGKYL